MQLENMLNYELILKPISGTSYGSRHNIDGYLTFSTIITGISRSYTQLFRNGIIEIVDSQFVDRRENHRFIYPFWEQHVIDKLNDIVKFYQEMSVDKPYVVLVSMVGVKGASLKLSGFDSGLHTVEIERDQLTFPDVIFDENSQDWPTVMRPIFDAFWNACGYNKDLSYDKNDKWKPFE